MEKLITVLYTYIPLVYKISFCQGLHISRILATGLSGANPPKKNPYYSLWKYVEVI